MKTRTTAGSPQENRPPHPRRAAGRGRAARNDVPRSSHGRWEPATDRPDPVSLLEEQGASRVPELVPVRYGRMLVSPFTFYRGAALSWPPISRHPSFRVPRAALRRRPPFELRRVRVTGAAADVRHQRLRRDPSRALGVGCEAAGGELRGRRPRPWVPPADQRDDRHGAASASTASPCVSSRAIATSTSGTPTSKSRSVRADASRARREAEPRPPRRTLARRGPAQHAGVLQADPRGRRRRRIVDDPPLVVPFEDCRRHPTRRDGRESCATSSGPTGATLRDRPAHAAGGVPLRPRRPQGRRCRQRRHPCLDPPAAGPRRRAIRCSCRLRRRRRPCSNASSARAVHAPRPRVVAGQRLMQAATDIFLGWQRVMVFDGRAPRLLRASSAGLEGSPTSTPWSPLMTFYARLCGATLARAHARSGDRIASPRTWARRHFDGAIADFAGLRRPERARLPALVQAVNAASRSTHSPGCRRHTNPTELPGGGVRKAPAAFSSSDASSRSTANTWRVASTSRSRVSRSPSHAEREMSETPSTS